MKANYLFLSLGLLAGCAKSQKSDEAAVQAFFASTVRPPRKYEPLKVTPIEKPAHAQAMADENWFAHRYAITDSLGNSRTREDTVVVQANGRVQFW